MESAITELRSSHQYLMDQQREVSAIISNEPAEWRRLLVRQRRAISRASADFQTSLGNARAVYSRLASFAHLNTVFGRVRHLLAVHQSMWPAVTISRDDPGFKASIQQFDEQYTQLKLAMNALEADVSGNAGKHQL